MAAQIMSESSPLPVLIVGGGPVGLLLALMLHRYKVPTVVVEAAAQLPQIPRGSTHNARTMEHYRVLGLSEQVRRLGLPWDHPTDIAFRTRYRGPELTRLRWPSPGEAWLQAREADRLDQVPEPMHRANQMYVESLLEQHAERQRGIRLLRRRHVIDLAEGEQNVRVVTEEDGRQETWWARYVIGCDGGHSFVRRVLGIRYEGATGLEQDVLGRRAVAAHVRIPSLNVGLLAGHRAWSNWVINAEMALNLIAVNGVDEFFLLSSTLDPDRTRPDEILGLIRRAAGAEVHVEVMNHRPWTPGAALVAERFGSQRVFLAGDAAHLFTPNGGFGMNTGMDDAANLAWKIAGTLHGWGGRGLLSSYDLERRPVALRNTAAARAMNIGLGAVSRPAALESEGPEGELARRETGRQLYDYGLSTLETLGIQLGARYDGSPVLAADTDEPPADSWRSYVPSAVPGGRTPHFWFPGGPDRHSLFDRVGTGFTFLRLRADAPSATPLNLAADRRGVPLRVLDVEDPAVCDLYGRPLVLIRPDQYVCWRGDRLPEDTAALLARVTGWHRPDRVRA